MYSDSDILYVIYDLQVIIDFCEENLEGTYADMLNYVEVKSASCVHAISCAHAHNELRGARLPC